MISFKEYKKYYLNYVDRLLGIREQELDVMAVSDVERRMYFNYVEGTRILLLVTFIETNFLEREQVRSLRNFENDDSIATGIIQSELSCFYYVRDCVGHNPKMELFDSGGNTVAFLAECNANRFSCVEIVNNAINITPEAVKKLHMMIRTFYEV